MSGPLRLVEDLQPGTKYQISYQIPGLHRKPRLGVAVFLEVQPKAKYTELIFHGEDKFGVTRIDSRMVQFIQPVIDPRTPCYMDKVAK